MTVSRTHLPKALVKGKSHKLVGELFVFWLLLFLQSIIGHRSRKTKKQQHSIGNTCIIDEPMRALDYARPQVHAMCTYIRHM